VLEIPVEFDLNRSVKDSLIRKFGYTKGKEIARITQDCLAQVDDVAALETCVKSNLPVSYSTAEKDEVWDFLYHFVIVG
jgi:hypothetical protein